MKTIQLSGHLETSFGSEFLLAVNTPAQAIRALCYQVKGFEAALKRGSYRIVKIYDNKEVDFDLNELGITFGRAIGMKIEPTIAMAGGKGGAKAVLGLALVGAAFFFSGGALATTAFTAFGTSVSFGQIALTGTLMALSGVAGLLTPVPKLPSSSTTKDNPSFLFDGIQNTSVQGSPVPVAFGECWGGSVVASLGITTEDIPWDTVKKPTNTLRAASLLRFVDILSEGPIRGLVDGDKSIYLNNTVLQNEDDSYNFQGVETNVRLGTDDQDYIEGFSDAETEKASGAQIEQAIPVVITVTDDTVNAVRVKIRVPSLIRISASGSKKETSVVLAFDVKPDGGSYSEVTQMDLSGRTISPYERSIRIDLPAGGAPWSVRVRRITDDSEDINLSNDTYLSSYTEIIDAKLIYPDTAIVGGTVDSQQFGSSLPDRKYHFYGIESEVPSNYDPETREYDGVWDGTFVTAYHNNPAWVLWALMTNSRYGCGDIMDEDSVDKYGLYTIAQYCDELVPDGKGGFEPRYSFNGIINTQDEAAKVLDLISTAFRGMIYWGSGAVMTTMDAPADVAKIITPANIIGDFEYMGASQKARSSIVQVAYIDPALQGEANYVLVPRDNLIKLFGERKKTVEAVGCISRAQATRFGEWLLDTEEHETEVVHYVASLDNADVRPGQIIAIADPSYMGIRYGGRVVSATVNQVEIDAGVDIEVGQAYQITVTLPDGSLAVRDLTNEVGIGVTVLTWDDALDEAPQIASLWALASASVEPRKFRVISNTEKSDNQYQIVGLFHDPTKYDRIERDRTLPEPVYTLFPTGLLQPPSEPDLQEGFVVQGGAYVPSALLSWRAGGDSRITSYEIQTMGVNDTTWQPLAIQTSLSAQVSPTEQGEFSFRVRALSPITSPSVWVQKDTILLGLSQTVDDVDNFKIATNGPYSTLSWDRVTNPNLDHYELHFNSVSSGADWDTSPKLGNDIPGNLTSIVVPARVGSYFIKAVSIADTYSENAALVTSEIAAADNVNVVATIEEDPTFAGTHDGTVFDSVDEFLVLERENPPMSDWTTLASMDPIAGDYVAGSGTYYFDNAIDLGAVYNINISLTLKAGLLNYAETMSAWASLFDISTLDSSFSGEWSAIIYIRTTEDDPGGTPTWSSWEEAQAKAYTFRAAEFKIVLTTDTDDSTPYVELLGVTGDVPDRIAGEADVACGAGGLAVTFDIAFMDTPSVTINGQGLSTGDYHRVTSKSATGFTINFYNSGGSGVSRTFDWHAKGFGYRQ